MKKNQYLLGLVEKYSKKKIAKTDENVLNLKKLLKQFAGKKYNSFELTGSNSKGTSLVGESDFEILLSLKGNSKKTIQELYQELNDFLIKTNYKTKLNGVSIQINYANLLVDIIPGIKRNETLNYHKLYHSELGILKKTNLSLHVNDVIDSKKQEDIKLMKIWRNCHALFFPTLLLEQVVIKALLNEKSKNSDKKFEVVLNYLSKRFEDDSFVDPANSNQNLSVLLTKEQIQAIVNQAKNSLVEETIEKKVW